MIYLKEKSFTLINTMNTISGSFPFYVVLLMSTPDCQTVDIRPVIAWVERDERYVSVVIDVESGSAYPVDDIIIKNNYGEPVGYTPITEINNTLSKWKRWAKESDNKRRVYYMDELITTDD